jgi:hypothetical protein
MLHQEGEIVGHRKMPTSPDALLQTIAPYRDPIVLAVAGLCTWYWLADLWAREGIPFVLGQALSMQALHGGKAKPDQSAAPKSAGRLRGGMRPQASVSPAEMRATRDLRGRRPLTRTRAEMGKQSADTANRAGVAERLPDPAVQQSIAVALALLDSYDPLLRALELPLGQTAKQHAAHTLYLLPTVPGIGTILRLVLL